eukprot:3270128-Amphidinium_carterae.2
MSLRFEGQVLFPHNSVFAGDHLLITFTPAPKLTGGGAPGRDNQTLGKQLNAMRSVDPRYTMAQHKAMLLAAPKLQKLLGRDPDGATLSEAIAREATRLGVAPQLGQPAADSTDGFQEVRRKPRRSRSLPAPPRAEVGPVRTLRLAPGQLAWEGTPVPVEEMLLGGHPAVALVPTQEKLEAWRRHHKAQHPLVAVASKRYQLE